MSRNIRVSIALAILAIFASHASAQVIQQATASLPVTRVLRMSTSRNPDEFVRKDHPLYSTYLIAQDIHEHIQENIDDYTCLMVKRERIDGELRPYEYLYVKFRSGDVSNPQGQFGVYMKYLGPKRLKGQEALYVPGKNDGDILARRPGRRASLDLSLDPNGSLAMRNSRYPITEFGIENMTRRLVEVAREDMRNDDCEVNIYRGAKVDGRSCTGYEVKHEDRKPRLRFHMARVFVDEELNVPIRYEAYDWPEVVDGEPRLLEEYTFRKLKLNVGLTDEDFERSHPDYGFRKEA